MPRLGRYTGARSGYLTACHVSRQARCVGCPVQAVCDVPEVAEARQKGRRGRDAVPSYRTGQIDEEVRTQ